ncbi:MAG: hypothetical protein MZV49_21155 [Rhodopseudomonas palustris]|nr:hypothetical protein [Rhodopseudomonas palustris]
MPRRLVIKMHRLRVKLGRERNNFVAADPARAEAAKRTWRKIFKGK